MTTKLKGSPINIGGKEYFITPLSAEEYFATIPSFINRNNLMLDGINFHVAIIHAALKPNYPDMTPEDVSDILGFGNGQERILKMNAGFPIIEAFKKSMAVVTAITDISMFNLTPIQEKGGKTYVQ